MNNPDNVFRVVLLRSFLHISSVSTRYRLKKERLPWSPEVVKVEHFTLPLIDHADEDQVLASAVPIHY